MQRRMTITMDEAVYDGLMRVVGRGKVSQFLEALARPHVLDTALDEGYAAMRSDPVREQEASEWINGLIGDVSNAAR
ncbi:MAG: addiction module antitoxin [Burkholderiales bacterium PBB3]|nr:MAG: addiction module antitoxin [Burkholderiales bacterium PBB3]